MLKEMSCAAQRFIKEQDFVTRRIAGETVIVPVRGRVAELNSIYTLNEVGTLIWQLIDGQTAVSQIIEAITREYQVAADQAAQETFDFLTSLEAAGLIQPAPETRG
jgi:hypothetical protein